MTKEELIEKLRTSKGYLKSGVKFLADKWDISEDLVKECKKAVSSEEYLQEKQIYKAMTNSRIKVRDLLLLLPSKMLCVYMLQATIR